jgi:hypothetical protein
MCRIIWAATPKKCARFCHSCGSWRTRRKYASFTRAALCRGVIGALSPETPAGDAAQLPIDQGNQRIPRSLIAVAPISQEKAYLRG